jgi:hypothetical protein
MSEKGLLPRRYADHDITVNPVVRQPALAQHGSLEARVGSKSEHGLDTTLTTSRNPWRWRDLDIHERPGGELASNRAQRTVGPTRSA